MAENPSSLQAGINLYQRLHVEDPGGRYFVPLARTYREIGELALAERLLVRGIERHATFASAYVVLGEVQVDHGAHEAAAATFRRVLELDPQNLIALRSLAVLARAEGRADEAAEWFRRLLEADPADDEARTSLAELEPSPVQCLGGSGTDRGETTGAESERLDQPPDASWLAGLDEGTRSATSALSGSGSVSVVDDSWLTALDEAVARQQASVLERSASEPGPPEEGRGRAHGPDEPSAAVVPLDLEPAHASGADPDDSDRSRPDTEAVAEDDHDGLVTETLAELYARQGFLEEAADVYRRLIRMHGEQPWLLARLAELEDQAGGGGGSVTAEPSGEELSDARGRAVTGAGSPPSGQVPAPTDGAELLDQDNTPHTTLDGGTALRTAASPSSIGQYFASLASWKPAAAMEPGTEARSVALPRSRRAAATRSADWEGDLEPHSDAERNRETLRERLRRLDH
jgi:tetratricopeptide (TPR) repeat protein